MSMTRPASAPAFAAFDIRSLSPAGRVGAVFAGTLVLAVSSHIAVPMVPVPMTLQTLAVTLLGALYGWRLGAATVVAWLLQGAAGLPVFAGGGGLPYFAGPTAGYLLAFPLVAALVGWLVERGWNGRRTGLAFLAMLLGNAACLVLGAAWLAVTAGIGPAVALGVTPFLLGGLVKSALGAALLRVLTRQGRSA